MIGDNSPSKKPECAGKPASVTPIAAVGAEGQLLVLSEARQLWSVDPIARTCALATQACVDGLVREHGHLSLLTRATNRLSLLQRFPDSARDSAFVHPTDVVPVLAWSHDREDLVLTTEGGYATGRRDRVERRWRWASRFRAGAKVLAAEVANEIFVAVADGEFGGGLQVVPALESGEGMASIVNLVDPLRSELAKLGAEPLPPMSLNSARVHGLARSPRAANCILVAVGLPLGLDEAGGVEEVCGAQQPRVLLATAPHRPFATEAIVGVTVDEREIVAISRTEVYRLGGSAPVSRSARPVDEDVCGFHLARVSAHSWIVSSADGRTVAVVSTNDSR